MDAIRQNISHSASELVEAQEQQTVRVAGLITRIRPHTTKKGDSMAFATIEDFQGVIELVIFPRTYTKYQDLIYWDNIIMVDGKVDSRGAEPKVLVDHITTELDHVIPLQTYDRSRTVKPRGRVDSPPKPDIKPSSSPPPDRPAPTSTPVSEPAVDDTPEWDDSGMPPPPEEFPFGWDEANGIVLEPASPVVPPEPVAAAPILKPLPLQPPETESHSASINSGVQGIVERTESVMDGDSQIKTIPVSPESAELASVETPAIVLSQPEIVEKVLQPIVPPLRSGASEDIQMITVILRPRQDKARDKLLLRRIFGIMISNPGDDRFAFHIFERGKGHLLEFPNLTTGISPKLVSRITALVGSENIRIEPITFQ
jgi:DNA polymerase-3 subunit alpha